MPKLTFQTDLCKGCGLCVSACPKGCLAIDADAINKRNIRDYANSRVATITPSEYLAKL